MKKIELYQLLNKEIAWCTKNPQNMPEDWRDGFIDGLKQAKRLIRNYRQLK